ncbi:MAG: hypothetical protein IK015_07510 [Treponema sp.]|nr:hypothetical protein [Treponema sp.]
MGAEGNKVNVEELLLRQYDETLNSKDRLEAKLASYLTADSLILATLATFISISKSQCNLNSDCFIISSAAVFAIGLLNLLIIAVSLIPRTLWSFNHEKLLRLHFAGADESDRILKENDRFVYKNKNVVAFVRKGYAIVSAGVLLQILCFAFSTIVFFKIILRGIL